MSTRNPACTAAVTIGVRPEVSVTCGCGWSAAGFPSRRKAIAAQKAHRFPPPEQEEPVGREAGQTV